MVNRLSKLLRKNKKSEANSAMQNKEDLLTRLGREQLTKLNERGLDLPVALL